MTRAPLLIAGGLLLVSTAVLADMYQDASNAKDPEARNNLAIGTVKSIGGTPPDAITRFYTWDKLHPQLQVNAQPEANEWAVVQAGQTGHGPTHLCWSNTSTNVDCNYAAFGLGNHVFGNGAGTQLILDHTGTGPSTGHFKMYSGDDATARLFAESNQSLNVDMYFKAKGSSGFGFGNTDASVGNTHNIAHFSSNGTDSGGLFFTAAPLAQPRLAKIETAGIGIQVFGQFFVMASKTANYTIVNNESGTHFDNIGATGPVTITLPAAAVGRNYCFTVDAAQNLVVRAAAGERIAVGAANSTVAGAVTANAPFASICLTTHKLLQWITYSTPDKAQWTVS